MAINIQAPQLALEGYLRAKQQEQEKERQEQLHEEAQAQLQEIAKFHAGNLDIQKKHLALTQSALKAHLTQQMMENIAKGIQEPGGSIQNTSTETPDQNAPIQGGISPTGVPATVSTTGAPTSLPTSGPGAAIGPVGQAQTQAKVQGILGPAQTQQLVSQQQALLPGEIAKAGGTAKAEAEAQISSQSSPEGRKLAMMKHAWDMDKLVQEGKNMATAHAIAGQYHLAGIRLENEILMSPQTVQAGVGQVMHGGSLQDIPNPKSKQAVENTISAIKDPQTGQNWITPSKDTFKKVQALQEADNLLKKWRDFGNKWSTDGEMSPLRHPIDYASERDALISQAGSVAKLFEGSGTRITNVLIDAQKEGFFKPFQDRKGNNAAVDNHVDTINGQLKAAFAGMPPSEINYYLGENGVREFGGVSKIPSPFDQTSPTGEPDWLSKAPQTHPKQPNYKLNRMKSLAAGKPIYDATTR
jgi:hypothetical protein